MPDISKIILPSGNEYNIKDSQAREQIAALTGANIVMFVGVSTTAITDGGNEKPTINNAQHNPTSGQLIFYGTEEFIYGNDNKWHALGSLDILGDLAYKDTANATYQPNGTISTPNFTGTESDIDFIITEDNNGNYQPKGQVSAPILSLKTGGATEIIKNPSSVTVAKTVVAAEPGTVIEANPIIYYAVANETLSLYQLGYTTGDSITTSNVTVKTGDGQYQATAPIFTGTKVQLEGTTTAQGRISQPTFTGTQATIVVS